LTLSPTPDGPAPKMRRIAFVSSNVSWGGSEDLWSGAARMLGRAGHSVTAYKNRFEPGEKHVVELREAGSKLVQLAKFPWLPRAFYSAMSMLTYPLTFGYQTVYLYLNLRLRRRPDLVVVSQGGNHDGWLFASVCQRLKLPYVLICQKATDLYWPIDRRTARIRSVFEEAVHTFFVSEHNKRLTEEQLGVALERASVARNPFKVSWARRDDWPAQESGLRLACVGRLYPMEKGQDILLRVLARDKWRSRPVSVSIFGAGEQEEGLKRMARFLALEKVRFAGFATDIEALWGEHHGLLLPSRAEGLPLVLVEAMLSGRVAIVTDVAGNAEVVEDGATGFVAAAPTEDALDEAMERAWRRRDEWRSIGERAATSIRELVPADPAGVMAASLLRIADEIPSRPPAR